MSSGSEHLDHMLTTFRAGKTTHRSVPHNLITTSVMANNRVAGDGATYPQAVLAIMMGSISVASHARTASTSETP
jgi:hypothetical protein